MEKKAVRVWSWPESLPTAKVRNENFSTKISLKDLYSIQKKSTHLYQQLSMVFNLQTFFVKFCVILVQYVGHTESNEQQFFYKLKFIVM